LLDGFGRAAGETAQSLSMLQTTLAHVDGTRGTLANRLILTDTGTAAAAIPANASAARDGFASIVTALNVKVGNQSLFAGTATDRAALTDPAQMLADIRAAVAGATTIADIQTAVAAWFDQPTGGFATMGYLGDTGPALTRRVDPDETLRIAARADAPEIRNLLAATALAAVADDPGIALSDSDRAAMLRDAGSRLMTGADPLVRMRATLGSTEARLEELGAARSAQITTLQIARVEMTAADPYDTATRLQTVQQQLETHYTLTARLSRLTLTDYLR
jgi:flagellar hook-associated protein 3 FlgL